MGRPAFVCCCLLDPSAYVLPFDYFTSEVGRGTFSRRLAPWKGSIQPGYSGGRALTSSSCLSSSVVSLRSTAARLLWSWSRRLAPMMTEVTKGLAST